MGLTCLTLGRDIFRGFKLAVNAVSANGVMCQPCPPIKMINAIIGGGSVT